MMESVQYAPVGIIPTMIIAILLFGIIYYLPCWESKQEYIPGVPIVGVEGNGSLANARERFRKHAREMLLEGYSQVRTEDT